MRIRKHSATCFLLLTSLPHLLAGESSNVVADTIKDGAVDESIPLDLQQLQEEQQQEIEEVPIEIIIEEDNDLLLTDIISESTKSEEDDAIKQEEVVAEETIEDATEGINEQVTDGAKIETLEQPEKEDVEVVDEEQLSPSLENETPQSLEEEEEEEANSSSVAVDGSMDAQNDVMDVNSSPEVSDKEYVDDKDGDDEKNRGDETPESTDELLSEAEESVSEIIQEDGFHLPPLRKIETIVEDSSETEITEDETGKDSDDLDSSGKDAETIEYHDDDSPTDEDISEEEIEVFKEINELAHEILYDEGHKHIEISETTKSFEREEENEVVVEDDANIGVSDVDVPPVVEEEVVVIEDVKMAIGTTSVDPIDDDSVDGKIVDNDSPAIDGEKLEENEADMSKQESTEIDNIEDQPLFESNENEVDESDKNSTSEPLSSVDKSSASDGNDTEVEESTDDGENDNLNAKDETQALEDAAMEPTVEVSIKNGENDTTTMEETKEEVKPIEDDEDDEDLAERVSVDYASKSAGALIIEKSAEFKGTSNLITGDRDKYAIVPCNEERKQVVMSLSEDILVKEIKLANYERFSSTVKDFQVKGSHTLGKWVDLGTYTAKPGNGEQTFVLETPAWARYLKFRFLTHHGVEWFCTLSQIKVHGSNMVQDFHEHWENIEENKEEQQPEGNAIDAAAEASNATNEIDHATEKTGANDAANDKQTESDVSKASIAQEQDTLNSTENNNVDETEKGDGSPRDAQVTPSVHSKPRPLNQFRNHVTFSDIIQVEMGDDLYNLIPHTLGNDPAHAKNDLTCEHDHRIGKLAMDSLYRFGSRIVDDFVASDTNTGKVTSSKMNDFSNEFYQKRFGGDISSLVHLYANRIVYPTSPLVTDGSSDVETEELSSSAQDIGEVSQTDTEISASQAAARLSIEAPNTSLDYAIQKLLKDLPSAECLVHLDFSEFKNKFDTSRKSTGASGGSQGGRMMEPIFKKLTDEIFALQTSLSVHDQFSKLSVGCYQRVILDLALETEKLRRDQDERLRRLEEQILEPASMRMFQKLIVSLASTIVNWLISNGSSLFFTVKDVWIPKLLRYYLSKDTYDGLKEASETGVYYSRIVGNAFGVVMKYSSRAIGAIGTALESNGFTKTKTYQEYLSAWSAFYDGGITVVFIVITLLICRFIMMCSWIIRPNKERSSSSPLRSSRNGRTSRSSRSRTYSEEALYTSLSKKEKKKSSKGKRRQTESSVVPIVEEVTKETSEPIPELREETPTPISSSAATPNNKSNNNNNIPSGERGRDNQPATLHSPSMVSLEGE